MEVFNEIRRRFDSMDGTLEEMRGDVDRIDGTLQEVQESVQRLKTDVRMMGARVDTFREDVQALRGAFASIEAMLIAQAGINEEFRQRIESLERRAS